MIPLRSFRRRFGMSSRRVAVQPHAAWYLRWLIIVMSVVILGGALWFAYSYSRGFTAAGREDLAEIVVELRSRLEVLEQDNAQLRADLAASESRLKIENAMRLDMTRQMKGLLEDTSVAKDEVAVMKALLSQSDKLPPVSINGFRVQRDGELFRYRLTLMHSPGNREFQGQLRLVANIVQDGRPRTLVLPEAAGEAAPATALSFRLFQPLEGTFQVPENATLRSLEVRVFENGVAQPRATQTALVS